MTASCSSAASSLILLSDVEQQVRAWYRLCLEEVHGPRLGCCMCTGIERKHPAISHSVLENLTTMPIGVDALVAPRSSLPLVPLSMIPNSRHGSGNLADGMSDMQLLSFLRRVCKTAAIRLSSNRPPADIAGQASTLLHPNPPPTSGVCFSLPSLRNVSRVTGHPSTGVEKAKMASAWIECSTVGGM
ncbi:hypothetical protein LZ31DRAFT_305107 [Colletotrichum somersetense]|nr:hypothetical protein LZ31DRAFT_305107 [Colletotrichum somersetense]